MKTTLLFGAIWEQRSNKVFGLPEQTPFLTDYYLGGIIMTNKTEIPHQDRLDSVILTGRVVESTNETISLEAKGALLTVQLTDVREQRKISEDESVLLVAASAKMIYESLVSPRQADGILSREAVVEYVECSRCVGGQCECSRCVGVECSRCVGGQCECSRCVDSLSIDNPMGIRGGFRRRIG
jgi:hypothetical protein